MIYITGDIHGSIDIGKLSPDRFPAGETLSRQDYLIICGDFGLPFLSTDLKAQEELSDPYQIEHRLDYLERIEWLSQRPYTILWVDGNHECFPYWADLPSVEWNGGLVQIHPAAPNVIHLIRGEYYTIDGKTFWVMGGAFSFDKRMLVPELSWWPEEIPSEEEFDYGLRVLEAHGNSVDYVITHSMPQSFLTPVLNVWFTPEPVRSYLDRALAQIRYGYWFCGHYHHDLNHPECRIRLLFQDIVPLDDFPALTEDSNG